MENERDIHLPGKQHYTKVVCYPSAQITSHGIWFGNNSFFYTLPSIMIQIAAFIVTSRATQILLKPFGRQSTQISFIIGGILLGPSALGRIPGVRTTLFPETAILLADVMGCVGIICQTFSISVKMSLSTLTIGRKPAIIGFIGILCPVAAFVSFSAFLHQYTVGHVTGGPFLGALAISLSLSPFAIVYSLLSDLSLLNTELGRLSLTIAMINEACACLMMLYVNLATPAGPLTFTHLALAIAPSALIIAFTFLVVRPLLLLVVRGTPEGKRLDEAVVVAMVVGALLMSVITDSVGLSLLEGCMVLGLVVPNGPPLGSAIEERTDTVTKDIFMPLFYLSIGQRLNLFAVADWTAFSVLAFLILVNMLTRLLVTVMCAVCFRLPFSHALTLGLVLNTKGYFDFMIFKAMANAEMVDRQSYAALVVVTAGMTMIGSPLIAKFSMQSRQCTPQVLQTIQHTRPHTELRLLACIHEQDNVAPLLNLLEATNPAEDNPVCLYVIKLVDLVGRATPMLISHKPEEKPAAFFSGPVFGAFYNCQRPGVLHVQAFTSISPYKTMHNDVCALALQKKVSLVVVPFHKRQVVPGVNSSVDSALMIVNPHIVAHAPCSVGIVFDRGNLRGTFVFEKVGVFRIGVLFFGGPDDREALSYAARMAGHPRTSLTVFRFLSAAGDEKVNVEERQHDDLLLIEFQGTCLLNERIIYEEKVVHNGEETVNVILAIEDVFDLMVVGRRQWCNAGIVRGMSVWSENPELGVVGDLCSSADFFGGKASVLVMQQQTMPDKDDTVDGTKRYTIPRDSLRHPSVCSHSSHR
ncbi:hypothetical protein ACLOJK_031296 [Asimina triloba]